MEGFTVKEVAKLTGVGARTLDYWDHSQFIGPSVIHAKGTGSRRLYGFRDVVALRVAQELRKNGISLQALRKVVEYLSRREGLENPLASTILLTNGLDVYERRANELVSVLREPGQEHFFIVLDLSETVEELREAVKKLRAA